MCRPIQHKVSELLASSSLIVVPLGEFQSLVQTSPPYKSRTTQMCDVVSDPCPFSCSIRSFHKPRIAGLLVSLTGTTWTKESLHLQSPFKQNQKSWTWGNYPWCMVKRWLICFLLALSGENADWCSLCLWQAGGRWQQTGEKGIPNSLLCWPHCNLPLMQPASPCLMNGPPLSSCYIPVYIAGGRKDMSLTANPILANDMLAKAPHQTFPMISNCQLTYWEDGAQTFSLAGSRTCSFILPAPQTYRNTWVECWASVTFSPLRGPAGCRNKDTLRATEMKVQIYSIEEREDGT